MPHTISWIVEKKVLHIKYTGEIGKVELDQLNQDLAELLEQGEKPVHIISDQTTMERLNADLKSFRQVMTTMNDPRWGWIMLVGADPISKFFGQLVTHAFRLKLRMVKTLDEAKYALGVEGPELASILHS